MISLKRPGIPVKEKLALHLAMRVYIWKNLLSTQGMWRYRSLVIDMEKYATFRSETVPYNVRHQKLVEETPSPVVNIELRKKWAQRQLKEGRLSDMKVLVQLSFLVDKNGDFYFMEMNTRIQVEHPVTEQVTNFDLIKEQIKVAAGEKISGKNYFPELFSMECRINAEDPSKDFRPSPGKITSLNFPGGQGVRIDSHVYAGYTIPPNYDSMIAKLIVTAQTREECIVRMRRALDEFIIEGIKTTIPFHRKLMSDATFQSGNFTTKFLDSFDFSDLD
jgi:acetyl-CoA carboxylase biotin carboxylase subunit